MKKCANMRQPLVRHDIAPDPFQINRFFLRVHAEQVCMYTGDRCLMVGATGGEMRSIVYRILSSPRPFSTCNSLHAHRSPIFIAVFFIPGAREY